MKSFGPGNGRYALIGQTPVPEPDLMKWAFWFETADRVVLRTEIEGTAAVVSTVFLGHDHNFSGEGPPILFETMVFTDGDGGNEMRRCSTWLEAEEQHKRVVTMVRETWSIRQYFARQRESRRK